MKRIVDGVTYNTATSTAVARSEWLDDEGATPVTSTLYQTLGGAFFIHHELKKRVWVERNRGARREARKHVRAHEPRAGAQMDDGGGGR